MHEELDFVSLVLILIPVERICRAISQAPNLCPAATSANPIASIRQQAITFRIIL